MGQKNIVVLGAGVAGLTTALLLSRDPRYHVVVAAKHMPGDYDIEYASPWAGASYMPLSIRGSKESGWEGRSWIEFQKLARNVPGAGVHFQECEIHRREKDAGSATGKWYSELASEEPWFKEILPNFCKVPPREGSDSATSFQSVCINTAIYLPWLVSQCLEQGVVFKRRVFKHVCQAASPDMFPSGRVDVVVNCSGLSASVLGGVEDKAVVPARGQVVIVRNDAGKIMAISGCDEAEDEVCYLMTRAAGGGTVLGGSYQEGNWESQMDPNLAIRIMKRAVALCPELTAGRGIEHLDVIRHAVGLRPVRKGGTRIEKERIDGVWVVHNYGAGGAGYQSSYGCAETAVQLVGEAVRVAAKL